MCGRDWVHVPFYGDDTGGITNYLVDAGQNDNTV